MGITYQVEPFSKMIHEAMPLLKKHHKEIALYQDKVPFSPDWDIYFARERSNGLIIVTARSNGVLVGYMGQIVGPGLHFNKTLWSFNDLIWLDPNYREGWIGIKLITEMEKVLRKLGVQVFEVNPKVHFEKDRGGMQKILDRLGFDFVSTIHQKWLGE
jgi:hypothetical protein